MSKVRVKIYTGQDIICQCVGKGKNRRCKPKGKAYKFPGYYWVWMEEIPQPKENTSAVESDVDSSSI